MRWTTSLCLAALVAALAPVTATAAPRHAGHAASADRAGWAARRAELARHLPLAPDLAAAIDRRDTFGDDASYLVDAGDLNGDGSADFVDVRDHVVFDDTLGTMTETLRLEAHRGRDGALLWSATTPSGDFAFPIFTKTGTKGTPGVLVVTYGGAFADGLVAGAGELKTTITSYDGAGRQAWTTSFEGAGAYHLEGYTETFTNVDGILDAVPGGGLDILVRTVTDAGAADPTYTVFAGEARVQLNVVDGATGTSKPLGNAVVTDGLAYGAVLGDLDHDKRDDVAIVTWSSHPVVTALRSSDGTQLWTLTGPASAEWYVDTLPDATGDGVADVAALDYPYTDAPPTVSLVDGASGKVRWTRTGSRYFAIGDADHHPGSEIVVGSYLYEDSRGVTAAAYTGTGKRLWSVTRTVKTSDLNGKQYQSQVSLGPIGDENVDGVAEVGFTVEVNPFGALTRRNDGTVDGRTGRVRRDPVNDLFGTTVAIDGHGSDSYSRTLDGGTLTVSARRGDNGGRLWTSRVAVAGTSVVSSFGAYADHDRCGDLAVTTQTDDGLTTLVFSGATGKPLWAVSRAGDAAPVLTHPAARSVHRYAHTC